MTNVFSDNKNASNASRSPSHDDRLYLQSVDRTFGVLETLSTFSYPPSMRELAQAAKLDKSAVQRISHTLLALGYMERDPQTGGLLPGKRFLDRSFDYLRNNKIVSKAAPLLLNLRNLTGERVDFSLFDNHSIVYALRMQSKRETFFATLIGRRIPSFATSGGRACLSRLATNEAKAIIETSDRAPLTPRTIVDTHLLLERIELARKVGYSYALEESILGEIVVGAAVTNAQGYPLGAIHIAGSLYEWEEKEFIKKFSPLLIETAHALSD